MIVSQLFVVSESQLLKKIKYQLTYNYIFKYFSDGDIYYKF